VTTLPGKSWNLVRPFSRPGKSWKTDKVMESYGKSWKMMMMSWNLVKMHIIHCLPFTFPDISVRSLTSQRHLVSCCMIAYFVLKKYAVLIGHRNSFFWTWNMEIHFLVIEKSWKIIVEKEWSPCN